MGAQGPGKEGGWAGQPRGACTPGRPTGSGGIHRGQGTPGGEAASEGDLDGTALAAHARRRSTARAFSLCKVICRLCIKETALRSAGSPDAEAVILASSAMTAEP